MQDLLCAKKDWFDGLGLAFLVYYELWLISTSFIGFKYHCSV